MAFTYSLDDFAVTFFVTGNGFTTLAVEIYSRARRGVSLEINALSALMFLFTLLLVLGYYFIQQYEHNKHAQQLKAIGKRAGSDTDGETRMKKLMGMAVAVLLTCAAIAFGIIALNRAQGFSDENTLTIYNWGDYIEPELITKFEEESGYKVSYETFDSNEAMYTKVKQGGTAYDLSIPSEYMIRQNG